MSDDRKAKLAELRAKRLEIEAARDEKTADSELSDEIVKEERALKEFAEIEALEAEHGPIGKKWDKVDTGEGMICIKRPHPNTYKKFSEIEKLRADDCDRFVRPCVIYPKDKSEFSRILDEEPAALFRCATKCCELAGMRKETLSGK